MEIHSSAEHWRTAESERYLASGAHILFCCMMPLRKVEKLPTWLFNPPVPYDLSENMDEQRAFIGSPAAEPHSELVQRLRADQTPVCEFSGGRLLSDCCQHGWTLPGALDQDMRA